jgi:NADPH:quinone reductase-like Zn-dependent oxidoreductase
MKAIVLKAYGGIDQFSYEEIEKPEPGVGEVLVRIAAAGLNPIDWKLRAGAMQRIMPLQFPTVLGRDLAGEVAELGEGAEGFTIGQRVMALANHSYAEFAVVKADALVSIPEGMSFEQAAALPLVLSTGAQLIEEGIQPQGGPSVLITGAVGGVGRTAAYVAAQHHAQVIAVVRQSQMSEGESLGTLALVALEDEEALSRFKEIDAVADTVGGPVGTRMLKHIRRGGVYATVVGALSEAKDYEIEVRQVFARPDTMRLFELAKDAAVGRFKIPVARVMRLCEAADAQRLAEAGGLGGKIVLVP